MRTPRDVSFWESKLHTAETDEKCLAILLTDAEDAVTRLAKYPTHRSDYRRGLQRAERLVAQVRVKLNKLRHVRIPYYLAQIERLKASDSVWIRLLSN